MLPTDRPETPDPVIQAMRRSRLLPLGERILVALSGGPDSTALLLAVRDEGHDVVAAHFDHALQSGSAAAAEHVARLCDRLGVELVVERRQVAMPRGSVQAAARALRYEFLERARLQAGAQVIALGHTADDVVEGVAIHLSRGCGLAGLRGMPARRGVVVRPLLHAWRHDVVGFLASRGIAALEDPANSDPRYERVRVRRRILPALERDRPGILRRFHAVAMQATAMHDRLTARADGTFERGTLNRSTVSNAPEPVAAELLRRLFAAAGGSEPGLSRVHIASMVRLSRGGHGGRGLDLPGGFRFRVVGDSVEVNRSHDLDAQRRGVSVEVTRCDGCLDRDAAHLKAGLLLQVGFRRPGLRMRPLGGRGTRKLQDIFVDARVPREDRDSWPLVFAGDRLAWVPGIAVDSDLASRCGEPALHVTLTRILE
jgi:tRNA(Ile)-lysidine synthetase-like protein